MNSNTIPENSVLLMQFRQFTGELLKRKHELEAQFPPGSLDGMFPLQSDAPLAEPMRNLISQVAQMRSTLLGLLEQQAQRMQSLGGSQTYGLFREAEYIMAVLADELMLNAVWAGTPVWRLLEQELFQTHASGEIFFQRLDRLLASPVLSSRELAMVFFQALSLDFRGKYRGNDPHNSLERYRRQLYQRLYQHTPEEDSKHRLFPLSYHHETEEEARRISTAHLWWLVLGGVVVVWLLISTILWMRISSPIEDETQIIHKIAPVSATARGGSR